MFRPIALILVAAVCTFSCFAATADEVFEARRAIEAAYVRLGSAIANKDLDAIRAIHAPEYEEHQVDDAERDLTEVMAGWPDRLAAMLDASFRAEIDSLNLIGDEAHVLVRATLAFATSPSPPSKVRSRIETANRDVWIKTNGSWRLRSTEGLHLKIWVDESVVVEMKAEPAMTPEERAAIVRDLSVYAQSIATVIAGNGFEDLAGLDRIVGDASIVALGEASHGTAEFFQMKHRLLEYLVEKKGFTVFAIEGNWPEAEAADRYIKTGEGDAAGALAAMYFWTWQTAEVRAMLEWMRAYNARRGARAILSFTGFDMQTTAVAEKRVLDLLGRLGRADADTARRLYDGVAKLQGSDDPSVPIVITTEVKSRYQANAAAVLALLEAKRDDLLKVATPEDYRDAKQAARVVLQAVDMFAGTGAFPGDRERDRAMADNVRWLAEERFPEEKIVLWGHNGHVGTAPRHGEKSMGMHLRDRYGSRMLILGFASHRGEVRAKRMTGGRLDAAPAAALPLDPAKTTSVERLFHEAGLARFILDFRRIPKDSALGEWLAKTRPHRSIGAGYDPHQHSGFYVPMILPETYDGIVYIDQSTAARPLE